jgi:hypothetical protein
MPGSSVEEHRIRSDNDLCAKSKAETLKRDSMRTESLDYVRNSEDLDDGRLGQLDLEEHVIVTAKWASWPT